ncbi:hypothetical protein KAR48_13405 [bacterium]|nr:hypothetical protein [bacterium]
MRQQLKLFFSITGAAFLIWHCGKTPANMPEIIPGSIRISAQDEIRIDSINVILDDEPLEQYANPVLMEDITPGTHALSVATLSGVEQFYPQLLVASDQVTEVAPLLDVGPARRPFEGYTAPDFSALTLDSTYIGSSDYTGNVTLLFFILDT